MDTKRFSQQDGSTGSDAARAQRRPAPAPLAAPAYVDPRLESLWSYRSERVAPAGAHTLTSGPHAGAPAPVEAA